jgi:hypothetical protein
MASDDGSDMSPATRPVEVRPTNRVNVAFGPFSKIEIQEPSREFAELAAVVAELAIIVEGLAPGPGAEELRRQAQRLAAQLH